MRTSVNFRAFNWNDRPQIQMVGLYDRAHYLVSSNGLPSARMRKRVMLVVLCLFVVEMRLRGGKWEEGSFQATLQGLYAIRREDKEQEEF